MRPGCARGTRLTLIWISPVSAGGASARQGGAPKEKAAHEGRPEFEDTPCPPRIAAGPAPGKAGLVHRRRGGLGRGDAGRGLAPDEQLVVTALVPLRLGEQRRLPPASPALSHGPPPRSARA